MFVRLDVNDADLLAHRCAGEEELVFVITEHGATLPEAVTGA
jgi:hypothetical protein